MKESKINYLSVESCPLCGAEGVTHSKLTRPSYFFGTFKIPLPDGGVYLRECSNCSLLYKTAVPERTELAKIMAGAAVDIWKQKKVFHSIFTQRYTYII